LTLTNIYDNILIANYRGERMKKEIPLLFKVVFGLSIFMAFYYFLPIGLREATTVNKKVYNTVSRDLISEKVIDTFDGQLTGYGPDCYGCSGKTAFGLNVQNGNIYFNDNIYGETRIIAADKKYPFGTIVRITAPEVYKTPIIAVVLDRGGRIRGNKFDLLFSSEKETEFTGLQKNVKYEVLRYGW